MMFNYGFFPQTWEDPDHLDPDTQCRGDNDPLDVVEVGVRQMKTGEVQPVKVLGVLGMIDDGETDWKACFCLSPLPALVAAPTVLPSAALFGTRPVDGCPTRRCSPSGWMTLWPAC